jgi:hypothetical protein
MRHVSPFYIVVTDFLADFTRAQPPQVILTSSSQSAGMPTTVKMPFVLSGCRGVQNVAMLP